jgi:hypothetical protein
MKAKKLYDIQRDLNRFFLLGSRYVRDDSRMRGQISLLHELESIVPAIQKISFALEDLINNPKIHENANKLMDITLFLYSLLYAQGEMVPVEEKVRARKQKPVLNINRIHTTRSYSQLKPVIEVLTHPSCGSVELLEQAFQEGFFNDMRLYPFLDQALTNEYTEISNYVEHTLIPAIGRPMILFLANSFQYEDTDVNVKRFRLLCSLGYAKKKQLINEITERQTPKLMIAALEVLSKNPANEAQIIQIIDSENEVIRLAAYNTLIKLNTPTSRQHLIDLYHTPDYRDLAQIAFILSVSSILIPDLLEEAIRTYESLLALEDKSRKDVWVRTLNLLSAHLTVLRTKKDASVHVFARRIVEDPPFKELVITITSRKRYLKKILRQIGADINTILEARCES